MTHSCAEHAADVISGGIGRRGFVRAVAAMGTGVGIAGTASCSSPRGPGGDPPSVPGAGPILQPGGGSITGDL